MERVGEGGLSFSSESDGGGDPLFFSSFIFFLTVRSTEESTVKVRHDRGVQIGQHNGKQRREDGLQLGAAVFLAFSGVWSDIQNKDFQNKM